MHDSGKGCLRDKNKPQQVKTSTLHRTHLDDSQFLQSASFSCFRLVNVVFISENGSIVNGQIDFYYVQERNQLSIQLTNLQVDFDNVNARLEEETEAANSLRSQLQKAVGDYQLLKSRYDKEIIAKTEELEDLR
jgi:hypothetical protein